MSWRLFLDGIFAHCEMLMWFLSMFVKNKRRKKKRFRCAGYDFQRERYSLRLLPVEEHVVVGCNHQTHVSKEVVTSEIYKFQDVLQWKHKTFTASSVWSMRNISGCRKAQQCGFVEMETAKPRQPWNTKQRRVRTMGLLGTASAGRSGSVTCTSPACSFTCCSRLARSSVVNLCLALQNEISFPQI